MDKSRQDVRIPAPDLRLRGVAIHSGFLDRAAQEAMVGWIDAAVLRKSAQDAANALADSLNSN